VPPPPSRRHLEHLQLVHLAQTCCDTSSEYSQHVIAMCSRNAVTLYSSSASFHDWTRAESSHISLLDMLLLAMMLKSMFERKIRTLIKRAWRRESGQAAGSRQSPPDSLNSSSQKLLTFLQQLFFDHITQKCPKSITKATSARVCDTLYESVLMFPRLTRIDRRI
jgi:hypothetical protein